MSVRDRRHLFQCYQGMMIAVLVALAVVVFVATGAGAEDYWARRAAFIAGEDKRALGGAIELTEKERLVNALLMDRKLREYDAGFADPKSFIPANHIFDTAPLIARSDVFRFLRELPKGAMLHGHDLALASGEYLYNLTYKPDLFACYAGKTIRLHFFREPPADAGCRWAPIEEMRGADEAFDDDLRSQLTLVTPDHRLTHTDINTVWGLFIDVFALVEPLICYRPVFVEYFGQVLQELYDDNVMYLEFRSTLPEVYELDGSARGPLEVAALYRAAAEAFAASHPDFLGAKLIYAPVRKVADATMDGYVEVAARLAREHPTFLAGFDLVGQEDLGRPLAEFAERLLGLDVAFFFHAGETNWSGTETDLNLVDAVLLGTKRIGHGYAIAKHPGVAERVRADGIAVEISPISNQVLMLVGDLRNHPGNYLLADGYPVVVTSDDPGFWGARALTHDWYMAFMGMASRGADLRFLKQLALNSIEYSAIGDKAEARACWEKRWDEFLNKMLLKSRETPSVIPHRYN